MKCQKIDKSAVHISPAASGAVKENIQNLESEKQQRLIFILKLPGCD